jgi:hypothetical protein
MTTTPVDMMSEAWIDKIEAETKTPEQTFKTSKNMTVKKTTSSIATRGLDSFLAFQSKEFISGYQNLVTIQPLNKSKTRGWFVEELQTLTLADGVPLRIRFAKGSVLWNYKQTFGMAPNTSVEEGLNFTAPRLQILLRSPLMVEETTGMRQTIGTFDNPDVKELWDADKLAADLANSKGDMYTA